MLEERAATWPKQWMAQGFQKGRKEGHKEGRKSGVLEGQRMALSDQFEERFGSLKPRQKKLIAEASREQLSGWLKAILSADTVDDLFRS